MAPANSARATSDHHGQRLRPSLPHLHLRRITRRGRRCHPRGMPAPPRDRRGGDPTRSRPTTPGPERPDDAPPGGGPGRDPLGCLRGQDPRNPDLDSRQEQGRAPVGLRRDARDLPALPRGLHDGCQVRDPELAGRRARERARDDRARRGGRDRPQAAERVRGDRSPLVGSAREGHRFEGGSGDGDPRGDRGERCPLSRRGCRGEDVRADRRRATRGRQRGRRGRVRRSGCPGRPGRPGLRQARGGPGEGDDVACPPRRASRSDRDSTERS